MEGEAGAAASESWPWQVECGDGHEPTTPLDYGRCALEQAQKRSGYSGSIRLTTRKADAPAELASALAAGPESFVAATVAGVTWILGSDDTGAMYGALDVAERLTLDGASALPLAATVRATPKVAVRAANPFLTLPEPGEAAWWFLDEDFWRKYLDLLAHARFDLLDLHGTYDLGSTVFPNMLLQFATSKTFPQIGVTSAERERNTAMLQRVVNMAAARGIRVALMTYNARPSLSGTDDGSLSDADLQTYTREAVKDLATRVPNLAYLGFRIGESGRAARWYVDSFVAGVRDSGTSVGVSTRTWVAPKPDILTIAGAVGPELLVESKFNGEHWAAPYAIAGGAFVNWSSYSYQSFLTPPAPYDFIFQVRAGGTHRIFRQVSYARTRATVRSFAMSELIRGFTLEPPHAYTPQRDEYHVDVRDRLSPWTFVRDDLFYLLWGRLAYDPETPEATFSGWLEHETGRPELWDALQAASEIVPWIQTARTCGPDARDFAPELETGGDLSTWVAPVGASFTTPPCTAQGPFDRFAIASPAELADDLTRGTVTTRVSPVDVADRVLKAAERAAQVSVPSDGTLARDVARDCIALSNLGRYFAHRLLAATALAVFERTGTSAWAKSARSQSGLAASAWSDLSQSTGYIQPFSEGLRMRPLGFDPFHWRMLTASLASDMTVIDAAEAQAAASPPTFSGNLPPPDSFLQASRPQGPSLSSLNVSSDPSNAGTTTVRAQFGAALPADAVVTVLWKPFDSEQDFRRAPATLDAAGAYAASVMMNASGGMFAVEVASPTLGGYRYPDLDLGPPYVAVAPE